MRRSLKTFFYGQNHSLMRNVLYCILYTCVLVYLYICIGLYLYVFILTEKDGYNKELHGEV